MGVLLPNATRCEIDDQWRADVRTPAAAILEEIGRDLAKPLEIGSVNDRAALPLSPREACARQCGEVR